MSIDLPRVRPTLLAAGALLALLAGGALGSGCATHPLAPVPADLPGGAEAREHAESLRATVEAVVRGGWNPGRRQAAIRRAEELGLSDALRTEWVDWFGGRNVVIEVPGSGLEIVYVVAHLDKTDTSPLKLVSLFLNGLLDVPIAPTFFSEGAVDNATGVAVALELARWLRGAHLHRTYRILLTGGEESGLRGARAHAARIAREEWPRIALAANIDSVGVAGSQNAVMADVSEPALVRRAVDAARNAKAPLRSGAMPWGAEGDHRAFAGTGLFRDILLGLQMNLPGGLIPQRSWFTGRHKSPVVVFSSLPLLDTGDVFAGLLLLPFGRIHGPRDNLSRVDPARLVLAYRAIEAFLRETDGG